MITLSHEGLFIFAGIWFGIGFFLGAMWMLVRARNARDDKAAADRRAKRNAKRAAR